MQNIKEIKVRFDHLDPGFGKEIFKSDSINGRCSSFSRDSLNGTEWTYLTYGSMEPSHLIAGNVVFIICDKKWDEKGRDGNSEILFPKPFPTFFDTAIREWENIKSNFTLFQKGELAQWLKDKNHPDITFSEEAHRNFELKEYLEKETIHSFEWIGLTFKIVKQLVSQNECDARWYEISVYDPKYRLKTSNYPLFLGEAKVDK